MDTFIINIDFVNADFASRQNLFALVWGGKAIIDRVADRKIKSKGFVFPANLYASWTEAEKQAYDAALRTANDGSAPAFDFLECYQQVPVEITVDQSAMTFKLNGGSDTSFNGRICNVLINHVGQLTVNSALKTPGQSAAEIPLGSYLVAQIFYDASDDELYVVTWRRFQNQTVFTPTVTCSTTANVRTRQLNVSSSNEVYPLVERLYSKRWAIERSADYSTSIVQTRGLLSSPWVVLDGATFLHVPSKPKVVKFFLSRFFEKFDYPFALADFVVRAEGCSVAEGVDGSMAVTVTGPGSLELIPKDASRIFLGEDVIRTSDLHLCLSVI